MSGVYGIANGVRIFPEWYRNFVRMESLSVSVCGANESLSCQYMVVMNNIEASSRNLFI